MLFRSNLLAIVSGGSRPKFLDNVLLIYDDLLKKFILDITFGSSIRAVRMRNDKSVFFYFLEIFSIYFYLKSVNYYFFSSFCRLVVALLNQIHVFSFPMPTERLYTLDTRANYKGLCEVTPLMGAEKQMLVFPGHKVGSVQLVVSVDDLNILNY